MAGVERYNAIRPAIDRRFQHHFICHITKLRTPKIVQFNWIDQPSQIGGRVIAALNHASPKTLNGH